MANVREVERKGGRAYEVRWRAGDKFKQRTFTVKREADRFALKVETELAEGNTTDLLVKNGKTVRQVIEASLAASKHELKPRTYNGYVAIYDNRILPKFGARKVGTLTRSDVQAWVGELHAAKLSPATVHHHYVALKKALRHALDDRLISYNPCDGVRLPKAHNADGFKPVFVTAAQVESLADLLDFQRPYGLLVRFAAYTGLRAGELTGLRIRDLNLKAGHVEVRQTLQHIAGEWVVGTPKSARSTRNVPLVSRALVADLREYLVTHPRSGDPDALVWPGRNPGSHAVTYERVFDVASFRRNYLKPALRSLEMDDGMRFHDLRHTFASLMLAAQFPPYEVSRWMGHANLATTDSIYAHLYPSDYSAHLDRFEAFVGVAQS
ncbi:tyrosine-type recombinase/integrase [Frigoribacterium sp. CFBP 8766]|uniref:tyrosine-type recombinase/integrase n=1 Tax=Frigoribacterium sp. CFBP 8766 TaxID=2775273 RepID=UPI00177F2980|nr:site-specific integrase [Frigoribacterium sp. CFBP 8766]MBD8583456.1 tyrosine-type recombinase/integrase [Frigoribacterium sp. CFBP 8766]